MRPPRAEACNLHGACPEPRAITSGAQPEEPTSHRKRPRRPCRMPRRPAMQQRHEAGVVSRVPRSSRLASAIGKDRNTDLKRRHRATTATPCRSNEPRGPTNNCSRQPISNPLQAGARSCAHVALAVWSARRACAARRLTPERRVPGATAGTADAPAPPSAAAGPRSHAAMHGVRRSGAGQ